MRKLLLFSLPMLLLSFCMKESSFQRLTYSPSPGQTLPYRLFEPDKEKGKRYPLVLFFHGAGERGNDNEIHLTHAKRFQITSMAQNEPYYILAPQCPTGKRWVEVDWGLMSHTMPDTPSHPLRLTMQLLDSLLKALPIDTSRIYVTGLSMGGYAAWDIISRQPGRFAAAMPVCGGGDEKQAPRIRHIPIWTFHGAKDKVVWPQRSRNMAAELQKAGGKIIYTEYPSVAHNSWDSAYADVKAVRWLFGQRK